MRSTAPLPAFAWGMVVCGLIAGLEAAEEKTLTYRHFRVTEEDGRVAAIRPILADPAPQWARDVVQREYDWAAQSPGPARYFAEPLPFVLPPGEGAGEPFYGHNHCPDIAWLPNGDLLAFGRGRAIEGRMAMSISEDMGSSWGYSASPFPVIGGAQRLVLMRLREGPLLFVSFTGLRCGTAAMPLVDVHGAEFQGVGLFAALSFDEGATWPVRRLLTPGKGEYEVGPYFGAAIRRTPVIETTPTRAEVEGYLAATQAPDGVIHLISSRLHYRFNLPWLKEPNAIPADEAAASDPAHAKHGKVFYKDGRFGGWPAHGGMWARGDEIFGLLHRGRSSRPFGSHVRPLHSAEQVLGSPFRVSETRHSQPCRTHRLHHG